GHRQWRQSRAREQEDRMAEMTLILDERSGDLLLDAPHRLSPGVLAELTALLGPAQELGCARPGALLPPPVATVEELASQPCVRIAGYYHDSLVEGPGRRSSALFSGCDIGCRGCWVRNLHD